MNGESNYIMLIINKIEEILQWRPISEWAEYDYKKLSDIIFQKTNTQISPLTLRRIFNNPPGTYNPKQGTKDALAKFVGYPDWQGFIETERPKTELKITAQPLNFVEKTKSNKRGLFITGFLLVISILAILTVLKNHNFFQKANNEQPGIVFTCDKNYSDPPVTITLNYDISMVKSDSVFLNYLYNYKEVNTLLDKNKHEINVCLELPGIYTFALRTKNESLKFLYFTIKSRGWYAYYSAGKISGVYKKEYSSPLDTFLYDTIHDGFLYFPPSVMKSFGADITHPYFVTHQNINDFNANGNNCVLEARFCNAIKDGGIGCQGTQFYLVGDTGGINVGLTNEKCYSYTFLSLSGTYYSGSTSNLKALGLNVNEWGVFKIVNKNHKLRLVYNNDTIFRMDHDKQIGNIRMLSYETQGTGKLDYIRLYNENDSLVYCDDFD
jgi:hypothetical protein